MTITEFEIFPIKDFGETASLANNDAEADYFSLFGRVDGKANDFYVCIGDYKTRIEAELISELLDNNKKLGLPQL